MSVDACVKSTPDSAVFLAYLWDAFRAHPDLEPYDFEIMSNGGEFEACFELSAVCDVADQKLTELAIEDGLPGLFHYERMQEFADQLVNHFKAHNALPKRPCIERMIEENVQKWRKETV